MKEETLNEEQESAFVDMLIKELPEYGIDTSKWEYDHGDCCYGGAVEFISRCIKGYAKSHLSLNEGEVSVWEKALISLTPGGSEFCNNPECCIKFVKQFRESQHKMILKLKTAKEEEGAMRWVKISEQPPDDCKKIYFVIAQKTYRFVCIWTFDGKLCEIGEDINLLARWKPEEIEWLYEPPTPQSSTTTSIEGEKSEL